MVPENRQVNPIVVFTNGCFDLLHPGHIDLLERARSLGDWLVVGLNSDSSVRAIRGPGKPIVPQEDRAAVLRALRCVDQVIIFGEPTPERLIAELQPGVLVKGGDWPVEHIVGADIVKRRGGRVVSLPIKPGYSTTLIIDRILASRSESPADQQVIRPSDQLGGISESINVKQRLLSEQTDLIRSAGNILIGVLGAGGRVFLMGSDTSSADAQYIAAQMQRDCKDEQRAWPVIALSADSAVSATLGNGYGFDHVFSRQIVDLAKSSDCVVALSTSGNSTNVLSGVIAARQVGCKVIGLTGADGKQLASICDVAVLVTSRHPAHIHEAHITIGLIWAEMVDNHFSAGTSR